MNRPKEQRFELTTFISGIEQAKHPYKSFQSEIERNGFVIFNLDGTKVNVYHAVLAVIFNSKELLAFNKDTQKETAVNGWEYLKTYIEAYKEGEQYFETEFKVSPNTLYGINAEQYVRDIHLNFFHVLHNGANKGWNYVKNNYPLILTHRTVKEFGYYSGIVNKVEQQIHKHPRLFATFDKCEHDLAPEKTETKTDKLKARLGEYGFFELPMVKQLSTENQQRLIELISAKGLPYTIAMIEHLGFLKHLKAEHYSAETKLFKAVANCFGGTDRAVKGNYYVLNEFSNENRTRYTADQHKQTVQKDYEALK
jgi:hypothetical protein